MNRKLLTLFCLALISTLIQASSKTGTVTIRYTSYQGYHVLADFEYDYSHADNSYGTKSYPMQLGLYTSQTLLPDKCLSFNSYQCSYYNCVPYSSKYTVKYPYFSATGSKATTSVFVDYTKWSLSSQALIADSCNSKISYGQYFNGIIGMGVSNNAAQNFIYDRTFAIYLNKDESGGQLHFKPDTKNYGNSSAPLVYLFANTDWQISLSNTSYIQIGVKKIDNANSKIIFDLSASSNFARL